MTNVIIIMIIIILIHGYHYCDLAIVMMMKMMVMVAQGYRERARKSLFKKNLIHSFMKERDNLISDCNANKSKNVIN